VTYELEGPDVYQGMNPAFVRQVWAKRRKAEGKKRYYPPTVWTEEQKALVGEWLLAGHSSGKIAAKLGKTPASICGLVHSTPELKAIGFRTVYAEKLRRRPTP
jgi:hypothetical protein